MKQKRKRFVTVLCVVMVFVAAVLISAYAVTHRDKGTAVVVPVAAISTDGTDMQQVTGMVTTGHTQSVYLDGTTEVKEVYVSQGDSVKVGDKLLQYDSTALELSLEREELSIQSSELSQQLLLKEIDRLHALIPSYVSRLNTKTSAGSSDSSSAPDSSSSEASSEDSSDTSGQSSSETSGSSSSSDPTSSEDSSNSSDSTGSEDSSSQSEPTSSEDSSSSSDPSSTETSDPSDSSASLPESIPEDGIMEPADPKTEGGTGTADDPLLVRLRESAWDLSPSQFEQYRGKIVLFRVMPAGTGQSDTAARPVYTVKADLTQAQPLQEGTWFSLKIEFRKVRKSIVIVTVYQKDWPADFTVTFTLDSTFPTGDVKLSSVMNDREYSVSIAAGPTAVWTFEAADLSQEDGRIYLLTGEDDNTTPVVPDDSEPSEDSDSSEMTDDSSYPDDSEVPVDPDFPDIDPGYDYDTIKKELDARENEYIENSIQLKLDKIQYEKDKKQLEAMTVKSEVDGTVTTMNDPENLMGGPYMVLTAGEGYYITGTMDELNLQKAQAGQQVVISSWMTGQTYLGSVIEVSDYPSSEMYYGGEVNPNSSYYPFTVRVDSSVDGSDITLTDGEYVGMTVTSTPDGTSTSLYVQPEYIRTEHGESFVMKRGEDGLLHKQVVTKGGTLYGYYVEVRDGLTMDDYVAFPYGVSEGMTTEEDSSMGYIY